jgi:predicted enzyme related to lactoylglutathione lyase
VTTENSSAPQAPGTLAGINVWSPAAKDVAGVLAALLGIELRERDADDGTHYSARTAGMAVSVHPSDRSTVELAFVVEDMETALASCTERGCRVETGPDTLPYGVSAHLVAPGETGIELVQMHKKS